MEDMDRMKKDATPTHEPLEPSLHLLFALAKHWEISADQMLRNTGKTNDPLNRTATDNRVSQLRECAKQLRQRATWVKEQFEIADLIRLVWQRIEQEQSPNRERFALWLEHVKRGGWGQLLTDLRSINAMDSLPDFSIEETDFGDYSEF